MTIGLFGLAYLSLSTYTSFVKQFGRTYDIVRTLFSAYIHKLIRKQLNLMKYIQNKTPTRSHQLKVDVHSSIRLKVAT